MNYKKIFSASVVLSGALAFTLSGNVSAYTDGVLHDFDVYVNGYQCHINKTKCTSAGATIDSSTNTVRIKNFNGTDISIASDNTNSTLYFVGDNTITISRQNYGIRSQQIWDRDASPTTPGILTIAGDKEATLNIIGDSQSGEHLFGVLAAGGIIIDDNISINITLTDSVATDSKSAYGIYANGVLTSKNGKVKITTMTNEIGDTSKHFGVRAETLLFEDGAKYELDLAEHSGDSVPFKTSVAEPKLFNATSILSDAGLTVAARPTDGKVFSFWEATDTGDFDVSLSPTSIPLDKIGTDSVIVAHYEDVHVDPEPTEYEVLSMGVEGEYEPEEESTFRDYIETEEIADERAFIIRIDANLLDFVSIKLDDILLNEEDYGTYDGSVIVRLSPTYLSNLANGSHYIDVSFADGFAQGVFSIVQSESNIEPIPEGENDGQSAREGQTKNPEYPQAPETGENTVKPALNAAYNALIILSSMSVVAVVLFIKRYFKHRRIA